MDRLSRNTELQSRKEQATARGVSVLTKVFAARAQNAEIWDVEGNRYIDFAGGIGVLATGHCHPRVIAAAQAQLGKFTHTCWQVMPYPGYVELAEKLNRLAPGAFPKKTALFSTGAEGVENAVKIARVATGRSGVVSFTGAFHGRTMMAMALTGKVAPYKTGFGPFPAEVFHAPFPIELHGTSVEQAIEGVERLFKADIDPARTAAVIIEPVQGEGGFYAISPAFAQALRALCDRHGIVFIADEVQTGAGRTGTWLACEQWGVAPDMITMAKSMAGGFPISAVIGKAELMDKPGPGGLGGTYAGSPLACAAALAVLDVFEEEKLLDRSKAIGERLVAGLKKIAASHKAIQDVRGLGAMVAIELFKDGDLSKPDADLTKRLCAEAARRGLILLSCGSYANVVRVLVPLTASDALIEEGLAVMADSFKAVA